MFEKSDIWLIYVSKVVDRQSALNTSDPAGIKKLKGSLELDFRQYRLDEGDALVFEGCSHWRYRDRVPRGHSRHFCNLLFLHYVPNGCKALLDPLNWTEIFDIPELSSIEFKIKSLRTGLDRLQYKLNPEG